jgi:preprotein translocase subunit SecG
MNNEDINNQINPKKEILNKIIIWIIVLFISLMLILLILFQPRFYTFIDII